MSRRVLPLILLCVIGVLTAVAVGPRPGPAAASSVAAVSSGLYHTCALTTAGGVKCWGINSYGQLGDGTTTNSSTPVDVSGLTSGVAAVSAGKDHACAVTTVGGLKCWGSNGQGQLGDGQACGSICTTPGDVSGLTSGVAAVSAGAYHTCAIIAAGGLKCWGYNPYGALGDGTTTDSSTPVDVCADGGCTGSLSGVAAVSAGFLHTCALTTGGGVKCWGWNIYGQLGDGATTDSTTPVDVSGLTSGVAAVSAGHHDACAVTTGGGLTCWGYNGFGQLGDGTSTGPETCNSQPCSTTPVDVSGLTSGVAAVSAGSGEHTCALTSAGGLKCWGYNSFGQLGDGTITWRTTPADVSGLTSGVAAVSAGGYHTCALTSAGGLKCWGWNVYGQLGDGTNTGPQLCEGVDPCSSTPVDVSGLTPSSVSSDVPPAGGTVSTDPAGTGPTVSDPVTTAVTVPTTTDGGTVSIAETTVSELAPTSYQFVGQQVEITSTATTSATNPLQIVITLDASLVAGYTPDTIQIYRAEGIGTPVEILNCASVGGGGAPIAPDPCISDRSYANGTDIQITVLASSASHWNTAIAVPASVRVSNAGYSPGTATVQQGGNVQWSFQGSRPHSVTDGLGLGPDGAFLFDSGSRLTGTFTYGFAAAGTYAYRSTVTRDTMTGTIKVPVRSVPASGGTTMTFTVIWSTRPMTGYVFDVQYRFMKAGSTRWTPWATWKSRIAQPSATFVPSQGAGSYQFRARLRNAATGNQTGFSPEALITVD